jgi:hypothetical protein
MNNINSNQINEATTLTYFDYQSWIDSIKLYKSLRKQDELKRKLLDKYLRKIKDEEIYAFETCKYVYKKHPFENKILILDKRCFNLYEDKIYGVPASLKIKL